jgi:hypothetical protein
VQLTIYGAASRELCGGKAPVEAVEPCLKLRDVLADGVSSDELADLDGAIAKINLAYHFAPATAG